MRIEARRKVLITSKDGQSATAEWANFDVKANTALLGGGVVVVRGKDIAEGPRLKIDLTTGMYRFEVEAEAGAGTGREGALPISASPPATSSGSAEGRRAAARARPGSSACCSIRRTSRTRPRNCLKKKLRHSALLAMKGSSRCSP